MTELLTKLRRHPRPRRKTKAKPPKPIDMRRLEDRYAAKVLVTLQPLQTVVEKEVLPKYEGWVETSKARLPEVREDDEFEEIAAVFGRILVGFLERETALTAQIRREAQSAAAAVNGQNERHIKETMERVLQVDPILNEPWLLPETRNWVTENVSLIKSVGKEHLGDVEQIIYRMVRGGNSMQEVRNELERRFNVTRARARLIARDQVNKYNANLTEARQVNLGIKEYIWMNVQDQRVRGNPAGKYPRVVSNHWIMHEVRCRWDDPTVYWNGKKWVPRTARMPKVHPGIEIQCRCTAVPVLDDLLAA